MRAPLFNLISKGRLAWLLGLVLLMPLAQTAANWHLVSHAQAQATQRSDDPSAGFADYCDLCQTALATSAGLLPTLVDVVRVTAAPIPIPQFAAVIARLQRVWPPYASRAPPFALN